MKKAVMYGAGNIGRGFIGKTFSESGYEVCFIEVNKEIVKKLNEDRQYPVRVVQNDGHHEEIVRNVRAVDGTDIERVAAEIETADIMATAVGVNILPCIVKPICAGLKRRLDKGVPPLNIIICENLIDSDKYLRGLIEAELGDAYKERLDKSLGMVEASIGRMVPVMTDEMREGNILRVWVEPYDTLPVDSAAFVGPIPPLKNLVPFTPFGFFIKRKLFIHNLGHAVCAYLGWQKGYEYIWQCVDDMPIKALAKAAMSDSAAALQREYGASVDELAAHIDDLLSRFANRALGDTVARVGRDPIRKLGVGDRLMGAALYCASMGIAPDNIVKGIAAALRYDNPEDEAAVCIQLDIRQHGIEAAVKNYCGIGEDSPLFGSIIRQYREGISV
jgi:mannitol-1-phosphate 5-dehydrogenase